MSNRILTGWITIFFANPILVAALFAGEEASFSPLEDGTTFRERLARNGFEYQVRIASEYFGKMRGGRNPGKKGEYLGSVDASFRLNLDKLRLGRGEIFVGGQNLHGRSVNDPWVGAFQTASNLDSAPFTKLIEAWYSDEYLDGQLKTRIGRQYADSDFGVIDNGADFINSSYGLIPTNPMPTYPSPALGAAVWATPASWMTVGAGIFRGAEMDTPVAGSNRQGPYTIAEADFRPIPKEMRQSAVLRLGIWQQTKGAALEDLNETERPVRNYGFYGTADYWLNDPSNEGSTGPGFFFQYGWAPADRNEIGSYWGAGMAYKGIIGRRPNDVAGVGVTHAGFVNSTHETVVEFFYKWQVLPSLFVQPDFQWVVRPSGTGTNTLLAGIRLGFEY